MTIDTRPSNDREQARDLACTDALEILRAALLPIIYARPDGEAIRRHIDCGRAELRIDYAPDTLMFSAQLIGWKPVEIMRASLQDDAATIDLYDVIGKAFAAALSVEPVERQRQIGELLAAGLLYHVVRLRELGTVKALLMVLVNEAQEVVWSGGPGVPFDDRVTRPTLQ